MDGSFSKEERAEVLIQALPYIKRYTGKVVVVKYGGNAMINESLKQQVMEDIVLLWLIGVKIVLVHGGGPEISDLTKRLGYVGQVTKIHIKPVMDILSNGYIPVIATVGCDREGHAYNINGDTASAYIAGALHAERLILMTDIAGVLRDKDDPSSLIPELTVPQAKELYEEGVISGGMIPKVDCCIEAIREGVRNVVIMDGRVPHSIVTELLTNEGAGTWIRGGEEYGH